MEKGNRAALTVEEAANELTLSATFTYHLVKTGKLRAVRAGDRWLVPFAAINEFLSGGNPAAPACAGSK